MTGTRCQTWAVLQVRSPLVLITAIAGLLYAAAPAGAAVAVTVQPGDTLWSIAARNNLTTRTVAAFNGLSENAQVVLGSTIRVPTVAEGAATLQGSAATAPAARPPPRPAPPPPRAPGGGPRRAAAPGRLRGPARRHAVGPGRHGPRAALEHRRHERPGPERRAAGRDVDQAADRLAGTGSRRPAGPRHAGRAAGQPGADADAP